MTKGSGAIRIAAVVASGLMVAGLFPPFSFSMLVWVALIPLLWALGSLSGKRPGWKGFGLGFLGGAVSCLIQFNWLSTVSWLGAVLLPLYLAIFWGAFGAFAATWGKLGETKSIGATLRIAFCLGAVWAGLEWLRGWLFTGFGWNPLGVAFHESRVIAQAADVLGVLGLSLLAVFFQVVLLQTVRQKFAQRGAIRIAVLIVATVYGYGLFRISLEKGAESVRLKTLLVQINIPQDAGQVLWSDLEIHQAYEDETLKALEALKASNQWPDWVMWPECALTGRILRTNEGEWATWQINLDTLAQVRTAGPFELIYGVNELEAEKDGDRLLMKPGGRAYNSIAAMSPENTLQTYQKRHLVIFGET
ncbi:MAG: apolipoprotein N-acyltransferase, partial [Luteolibacter sp.]